MRFWRASERGIRSGSWLPVMTMGFLKPCGASSASSSRRALMRLTHATARPRGRWRTPHQQHQRQRGSSVRHGVCAVHDHERVVEVSLAVKDLGQLHPLGRSDAAAVFVEHHLPRQGASAARGAAFDAHSMLHSKHLEVKVGECSELRHHRQQVVQHRSRPEHTD